MKTKALLAIILILGILAIANAETIKGEVSQVFPYLFMTQKGELFLLDVGETQTVATSTGRITVELLDFGYNPDDVSDVAVDDILFSDENPLPEEIVHITVPITNRGPGATSGLGFDLDFGDGAGGGFGAPLTLRPGETHFFEFDHAYREEGTYTLRALAEVDNDIDMSNNVLCESIEVGDPMGGGSSCGGGGGPSMLSEEAYIQYTVYDRNGSILEQRDFWITPQDIGLDVELVKMADSKALLVVPR